MSPESVRNMQLAESKNPFITVSLCVARQKGLSCEDALARLVCELAEQNERLTDYLEQIMAARARHPNEDGSMLHWEGGTVVIVPEKEKQS